MHLSYTHLHPTLSLALLLIYSFIAWVSTSLMLSDLCVARILPIWRWGSRVVSLLCITAMITWFRWGGFSPSGINDVWLHQAVAVIIVVVTIICTLQTVNNSNEQCRHRDEFQGGGK